MMGINCSACGSRVSRQAPSCPCCGEAIAIEARLTARTYTGQKDPTQIIGIAVCGILILGIIVCSAAIVLK